MTYYIFRENDKLNGAGQCRQLTNGIESIEVNEELYNDYISDPNKYIWNGSEIVENPDYEEIRKQKEKERIGQLTMTKRVFALGLKQYGISYSQLKELIATNEDAQLEWDLCVELQRNNPLLDVMASQMGITSVQLDDMFKIANGEINGNTSMARDTAD